MFNQKLFSFLYSYNRQLPTSVDTVLTLLGQRSGDRRLEKCLDLFKIEKVFTWNTIRGVKAVSFKMYDEFDESDTIYLDIQEDGKMFLSDGPLTARTAFPYHMISRFEHS